MAAPSPHALSGEDGNKAAVVAHAACMLVSTTCLLPVGALFGRHYRSHRGGADTFSSRLRLYFHIAFCIAAFVLAAVGVIVMAGFTRYWSGWHNYVGIVFFATATLGLVLLARLPRSRQALQQRNSRYPSFMALHWLLGIATLATAVVSVYSGVHQYHQQFGDHVKGYYVFLSAYLGIVLFVFGILELYSSLARLSCLAWLCPRLRGKKAPQVECRPSHRLPPGQSVHPLQSNTLLVEAGQNVDALPTIVSVTHSYSVPPPRPIVQERPAAVSSGGASLSRLSVQLPASPKSPMTDSRPPSLSTSSVKGRERVTPARSAEYRAFTFSPSPHTPYRTNEPSQLEPARSRSPFRHRVMTAI